MAHFAVTLIDIFRRFLPAADASLPSSADCRYACFRLPYFASSLLMPTPSYLPLLPLRHFAAY